MDEFQQAQAYAVSSFLFPATYIGILDDRTKGNKNRIQYHILFADSIRKYIIRRDCGNDVPIYPITREEITDHYKKMAIVWRNLANDLEATAYNETIKLYETKSRLSERSCTSLGVINSYSINCGMLSSLIDPDDTSAKDYPEDHKIFMEKLLSKDIDIASLFFGGIEKHFMSSVKEEYEEIIERSGIKVEAKKSTLFTCPFCKGKETYWASRQSRSLDEGDECLCQCANPLCGKKFKGH